MTPGEQITAYGVEDDEAGVAHYLGVVAIVTDQRIPKGPKPEYDTIARAREIINGLLKMYPLRTLVLMSAP